MMVAAVKEGAMEVAAVKDAAVEADLGHFLS